MKKLKGKVMACVLAASMTFSGAMAVPLNEVPICVAKEASKSTRQAASEGLSDWSKNSKAAASIEKYVKKVTKC